jgi:signal transduction histidine kinase
MTKGRARTGRVGYLGIKTKLLLMMASLLLLSISILFILHQRSEQRLLSEVEDYTDELSTAIEIAQEQPQGGDEAADPQIYLKAYADKLRKLGVKDVSIADASEEVQASTNPANIGRRLARPRRKGPKEYVVRGVLGEGSGPPGSRKTSTLTVPIVVGDKRVGFLIITRILDDFSALSQEGLLNRLAGTSAVFAVGMLVSLYLSWSFSRPLHQLTDAARNVAAGDLGTKVPTAGRDEIGALTVTFNEMVESLKEKQHLEERLHFAERSTAMGRLASAVAHEIRNPLNFINLSIDHVRDRLPPEGPDRREEFDRILGNVKAEISRLNRLVVDFLSFGKPMRLHPRPIALEEVVREVAALVEHKAKDQGISLVVRAEPGLPTIVADPELLKTCFLNLMINAVDAMPDGGILAVELSPGAPDAKEAVLVSVADNGHGMTQAEIATAFEPYFTKKETGLGLGLALTRKIVMDHGGSVALESAPGKGTTARIALPLTASPLPELAPEPVAP